MTGFAGLNPSDIHHRRQIARIGAGAAGIFPAVNGIP